MVPAAADRPLLLPHDLRLTPEQFARVCAANPDAVLELNADGQLITLTPTGGETASRNSELIFQLKAFARRHQGWKVFDSSTGFLLPDGAVFSPDAALVALDRWQALTAEQRRTFAPLCPDLVVELASPSNDGARLGWLPRPEQRAVEIWTGGSASPQRLENIQTLNGEDPFAALQLDLIEIWAG